MEFKVFRQIADCSFAEIAQTIYIADAEAILHRYDHGMVTQNGIIVTKKNVVSVDTPRLFNMKESTT